MIVNSTWCKIKISYILHNGVVLHNFEMIDLSCQIIIKHGNKCFTVGSLWLEYNFTHQNMLLFII